MLNQGLHRTPPSADDSPTALMFACGQRWEPPYEEAPPVVDCDDNVPLVKAMLIHSANVHIRPEYNRTALHSAVSKKRLQTTELLLQYDADINVQDDFGQTPLILAAQNDDVPIVHLLLAHGADPNVQDLHQATALHCAVVSADGPHVIPELLANGADRSLHNDEGDTPLQLAQKWDHPDAERLLRQGEK